MTGLMVTISAQAPQAADAFERTTELYGVPSKGDVVALWYGGYEHHFDVVRVVYYAPEIGREPVVCVSTDGYHPDEVEAIFGSKDQP